MVFLPTSEGILKGATYLLSLLNVNQIFNAFNNNDIRKTSNNNVVVGNFYQNPVIRENAPDPSVIKLHDGSGFALVASSEFSSVSVNSTAFPIYFSQGNRIKYFYEMLLTDYTFRLGSLASKILCLHK